MMDELLKRCRSRIGTEAFQFSTGLIDRRPAQDGIAVLIEIKNFMSSFLSHCCPLSGLPPALPTTCADRLSLSIFNRAVDQ
jgi:hypothetical protein